MSVINDSRPQEQTGGREKGRKTMFALFLSFSCLIFGVKVAAIEAVHA
jgi:hypothetical protein